MSDIGNKAVFAANLTYYMEKTGKTRNEICDDLGIAYSTFSEWVKGRKYPRIDKIEMLANYFGIMKSQLIESVDHQDIKKDPQPPQITDAEIEDEKWVQLRRTLQAMPDECVDEILSYAEYMKQKNDSK